MRKYYFLLLTYFTLVLSNVGFGVDYDPNPESLVNYHYQSPTIQGDLTNFSGEKVIVLYRGVHFLSDKFNTGQRTQYITDLQVNQPMYSPAAYELGNQPYGGQLHDLLTQKSQEIARIINGLGDQGECTVKNRVYTSPRYAFQELYSNNCVGFFKQLEAPTHDYEPIFNQFDFSKNPLISFSDRIKHPAKYGFGLKNYGTNQVLLPDYDLQGRPKHPILGKLYGIILDEAAVEELKPLNVMKAHHAKELKLHSHFRNDILSEREISIAGFVPEDYVVFEMPLQVPSFTGPYPSYYQKKYGLTKTRYNHLRTLFTNPLTTQEVKDKKSQDLMGGIIEAVRQDNKLIYKNCISPAIPTLFDEALTSIDAKISQLTLTYELE